VLDALAPLVALGALAGYFGLAFSHTYKRAVPRALLAGVGVCALFALARLVAAPGLGTAAGAAVAVALAGFAGWFFLYYSRYGAREDRPAIGDPFPDFALPTSTGGTFALAAQRGKPVLLVLYRGSW
jgi:cytochrome oxidase Cu insertion factor (SCO1/SenC/PrrC family)